MPAPRETANIQKYLERHAAAEIGGLADFPGDKVFQQVLVVPAFDEQPDFLLRLYNQCRRALVVLIVNQAQGEACVANLALFQSAEKSGIRCWQGGNMTLISWHNDSALLLVDRFSTGCEIPRQQGVGLARKIGCDLAVALKFRGQIASDWIHSTDADAILPADYFDQSANLHGYSAAVYDFRHQTPPGAVGTATRLYEQALRYYVAGLAWAGSAYAFHTIGSCLAVNTYCYCLARGFPKRNGGEDFYLLNKLAKLAPVARCRGEPIALEARASRRVPFGTGPAVSRILALAAPKTEFTSYDPRVFMHLRELLNHLALLYGQCHNPAHWAAQLSRPSREAWQALLPEPLYRHLAEQVDNETQGARHIEHWFDAFRTLKFIHNLQTRHFPPVALSTALGRAGTEWEGFSPAP